MRGSVRSWARESAPSLARTASASSSAVRAERVLNATTPPARANCASYAHSLSTALFLLFVVSFALHALGSAWQASEEATQHGNAEVGLMENVGGAQFWFESLQNWQSEFLSVAGLALLGIYLRERGSPESKQVVAPHAATGR